MRASSLYFITLSMFTFISCSTVTKKDCSRDMQAFGLSHGRNGSPEKYTDALRDKCLGSHPDINLEAYEKGFSQGWIEYCMPSRAFDMGRLSDRYISFCPVERESMFRQKYLLGKNYAELKDIEDELTEKMDDIRPNINTSTAVNDEYNKLRLELDKVKRDMQAVEVEGKKNNFQYK